MELSIFGSWFMVLLNFWLFVARDRSWWLHKTQHVRQKILKRLWSENFELQKCDHTEKSNYGLNLSIILMFLTIYGVGKSQCDRSNKQMIRKTNRFIILTNNRKLNLHFISNVNSTYTSYQMSFEDIVNTHDTFMKSLGIELSTSNDDERLPCLYWTPKLHKSQRNIASFLVPVNVPRNSCPAC